jgi:hypothetical protein
MDHRIDKIEALLEEILHRQNDMELLITKSINAEQEVSVQKFQCNQSQFDRFEVRNNSYQFGNRAYQGTIS